VILLICGLKLQRMNTRAAYLLGNFSLVWLTHPYIFHCNW